MDETASIEQVSIINMETEGSINTEQQQKRRGRPKRTEQEAEQEAKEPKKAR